LFALLHCDTISVLFSLQVDVKTVSPCLQRTVRLAIPCLSTAKSNRLVLWWADWCVVISLFCCFSVVASAGRLA